MTDERTTLYWKLVETPEGADDDDPKALGRAFINRPDGTSETVNGGQLMTRSDAQRPAVEAGYEFEEGRSRVVIVKLFVGTREEAEETASAVTAEGLGAAIEQTLGTSWAVVVSGNPDRVSEFGKRMKRKFLP